MISSHATFCTEFRPVVPVRYSRETGVGVLIDFGLAEVKEGLADELVAELKAKKDSAKEEEVLLPF